MRSRRSNHYTTALVVSVQLKKNIFMRLDKSIFDQLAREWCVKMLFLQVAKQLQPSVIFIGDCEKTFVKKAPKGDKTDPKRLKKDLPKILKGFKPEDRLAIRCFLNLLPFKPDVGG